MDHLGSEGCLPRGGTITVGRERRDPLYTGFNLCILGATSVPGLLLDTGNARLLYLPSMRQITVTVQQDVCGSGYVKNKYSKRENKSFKDGL